MVSARPLPARRPPSGRSPCASPSAEWRLNLSSGDKRFKEPAFQANPLYRRLAQSYLACTRTVDNVLADLEKRWAHIETARFLATILTTAAAPTNFLLGNPAALKLAVDSGGAAFSRGSGTCSWTS